jgi:hypothetical protein
MRKNIMQNLENLAFRPVSGLVHNRVSQSVAPPRRPFPRPVRRPFPALVPSQRALPDVPLLTIADLVKRLDVTTLAVNKWREGSKTRERLPSIIVKQGKANRVYIKEHDLVLWLAKHRPDLLEIWRE